MTPIQDRLRDPSTRGTVGEWYDRAEAAGTIDKAEQIIQRLLLRVQIGDSAAIEARKFLNDLNGHNAEITGLSG